MLSPIDLAALEGGQAMPEIVSDEVGIAFDMHGCPNQCRHCYLGPGASGGLSEADVRWAVARFRDFISSCQNRTPIHRLAVASWVWEPDYGENYRELYELEAELSDDKPHRYELLSVWRLAHDPDYAEWAKGVGPDTCQITFFGMEDTNDWFYRRKGAFRDAVKATERLLAVGMKPRWQPFLTRKLLPDLPDLLRLAERLRFRERVQKLGGEFDVFMHTPGPDGEARQIEHLRPHIGEVDNLPAEIVETTRKHFKRETLWQSEGELVENILDTQETFPYAYSYPEHLWLFVTGNWDIFTNMGTLEPWWRLGNMRQDTASDLLERFEGNAPLGLKTIYAYSPRRLAIEFGDPCGTKVYDSRDDLLGLYVARLCETVARGEAQ